MNISNLDLPELHANQAVVLQHPARIKVLVTGRRWGKYEMAKRAALEAAAEGQHVTWLSRNFESAAASFEGLRHIVWDQPGYTVARGGLRISLMNGASITFLYKSSSFLKNHLQDAVLDLVIIDEAAFMPEWIWEMAEKYLPSNGKALLLSTPRITQEHEQDYFRRLYYRAKYLKGHYSWQFSTADNPYIHGAEIFNSKKELSPAHYQSEILGQFVILGWRTTSDKPRPKDNWAGTA